jgi:COP9 signalosome complex subunit 3
VTFSDPPAQFTKEQVDGVLRDVQEQTALLAYLEQEAGRSKEYLGKVRVSFFYLPELGLCGVAFSDLTRFYATLYNRL